MSDSTYPHNKALAWLHGEIKTPPFTKEGRIEEGLLLRQLQNGEKLSLPESRPMPSIGRRCHELRIKDDSIEWRLIYRIDPDSIVIAEVFKKKTKKTPKIVISNAKERLGRYDDACK